MHLKKYGEGDLKIFWTPPSPFLYEYAKYNETWTLDSFCKLWGVGCPTTIYPLKWNSPKNKHSQLTKLLVWNLIQYWEKVIKSVKLLASLPENICKVPIIVYPVVLIISFTLQRNEWCKMLFALCWIPEVLPNEISIGMWHIPMI